MSRNPKPKPKPKPKGPTLSRCRATLSLSLSLSLRVPHGLDVARVLALDEARQVLLDDEAAGLAW
eukprot:scaffold63548_cov30-Phaeocystis_antarctica.AAC.1